MRLYLDARQAQERPFTRGLPRYVANHVAALVAHGDVVSRVAIDAGADLAPRIRDDAMVRPMLCPNEEEQFSAARSEGEIAYHAMSPLNWSSSVGGDFPVWAVNADIPLVVTLYDLFPLIEPTRYLLPPFDRHYYSRLTLVCAADLILAISQHVADDAIDRLDVDPKRVAVIGAGFDPYFAELTTDEPPPVAGLERPFAMTVSYSDPRKNTAALVRAWAALPEHTRRAHQLVVVGNLTHDDAAGTLMRVSHEAGLDARDVLLVGDVADATLRWLYRHTEVFVCPSLSEGFGLPVIEACAAGAPAITSDRTSLPEILDFPPATFDPTSIDSIAAVLGRALNDDGFRELLRGLASMAAGRYTWEAVALRTSDALQRLG